MSAASSEPAMIGPFAVRALLQKGPPRIVRAFDPRHKREVRLKLYTKTGDHDKLTAAHAAAINVRHPAIIPVFEVGQVEQGAYVAGALPVGKRLVEILADKPLSPRRAAVVARALAEGMAAAHERGFVHGDIHPAGVILDAEGGAAWIDFGAAAGDRPANPAYCAPERLGGDSGPPDASSDQYELGVLLFEMLTGQTPFSGDEDEIAEAQSAERAPSIRAVNRNLDRNLAAICRKAMSPAADDRYASCQDFADDLRRWLEGAQISALPPGRLERLFSNSRLMMGLAAAAILGITTLAVLLFVQRASSESTIAMLKQAREKADRASLPTLPDARLNIGHPDASRTAATLQTRERELNELRVKLLNVESKAREEKAKAEADKKEAVQARSDLEAELYCESISRSHEFWQKYDVDRAQAYLKACEPRDKKRPDLRNWEWQFLRRRYQPPKTFTLKGDEGVFANLEPRAADGSDLRAAICAYSPDGRMLAYCLRDDRVVVWNALIGEKVATTDRHRGAVCDIVFSPDGARFVTVGADKAAKIWQSSGELVKTFGEHGDAITAVAFRPDGQLLASGSADRTIRLWNPGEFESTRTLTGHQQAVRGVAFRPDGKMLASCDADGVIKLWDPADGQNKFTLTGHAGPVSAVCFSPDGQRLASAGADHTVRLWDVNAGKEIRTLARHQRAVRSVAFRPDGKQLATAGDDRSVCIWDSGGNLMTVFLTGHTDAIHRLAYRPDGRQFATASLDQSIKLWDAQRPVITESRVMAGHADAITALVRSPDGKTLATGGADKTIRIWDSQSGELLRTIEGQNSAIRGLAFAKNGDLASCTDDGAIKIWDASTGQPVRTMGGHTGAVNAVAFSPDGTLLASAGADGAVRIRQAATGQALISVAGHRGGAIAVLFNGDGTRILSSGVDGTAQFWDARTGEALTEIMHRASDAKTVGPPTARWREGAAAAMGYPARIAFSANGQRCAVVEKSGMIRILDMTTTWPIATAAGHDRAIQCLTFSADGRRLVSGDITGTIKVWDCKTGLEVLTLDAHAGRVAGLSFSRDGRLLYSAGADRVIRIWDGSPDDPNAKPKDGDETAGD